MSWRTLALILGTSVLVSASNGLAATRGIAVTEKATGATVALYAESYALVIGISDYTNGWPRLRGVKDDVPAVKSTLEAQGFTVEVVMDPDRREIDDAFRSFINRHGLKADNRLLFYFAGHGHSITMGYGGQMGYLVGRDAPDPNVDKAGFRDHALSMQVIETYARNIESKHALFVFDACFAGAVFDATRAIPEVIAEKTGHPVRQFITSGTADQQVPDSSIFRRQFVDALSGGGDRNGDGYITGAELGDFLETTVTNYSRRAQTPQYGKLRDPLLDKGDFVFSLPGKGNPAEGSTSALSAPSAAELALWNEVKDSDSPAMLDAYLMRFPQGLFAGVARLKREELARTQTASLAPATSGPSASDIRETQRLLVELGYSPGPADGVMGSRTEQAIQQFQSSHGLSVDGSVSDVLLAGLRASKAQAAPFQPGKTFKDCVDCPEMVVVPAGSFMQGSPDAEREWFVKQGGDQKWADREIPRHRVTIPAPFAVGKTTVTKGQFARFVRETGHDLGKACFIVDGSTGKWKKENGKSWESPGFTQTDEHPVVCVNWNDAKAYVKWLSERTGQYYRLLSESEWEYVARAGTETMRYWGHDWDNEQGCTYANVADKSNWSSSFKCADGIKFTAPVGRYRANGFGLHDVLGNVWEWTEDCWNDSYRNAPTDGSANTSGDCSIHVERGASWDSAPRYLRSAGRGTDRTGDRLHYVGFRVARSLPRTN